MHHVNSLRRPLRGVLLAACIAGALAGCGGGSGGNTCGTATTNSDGSYTLTGTCASGVITFSANTNTSGGAPLDSLGSTHASTTTVNINPLTTLALYHALAGGTSGSTATSHADLLALARSTLTASQFDASQQQVMSWLEPLTGPYGVASGTLPSSVSYSANGQGLDGFLDHVLLAASGTSGTAVQLEPSGGSPLTPLVSIDAGVPGSAAFGGAMVPPSVTTGDTSIGATGYSQVQIALSNADGSSAGTCTGTVSGTSITGTCTLGTASHPMTGTIGALPGGLGYAVDASLTDLPTMQVWGMLGATSSQGVQWVDMTAALSGAGMPTFGPAAVTLS